MFFESFIINVTSLGIPIQDPEQSELTEHGESGTMLEEPEQGKGPVSSSETELGTPSDPGASSEPRLGSNSGMYLGSGMSGIEMHRIKLCDIGDFLPSELF